MTRETKIGLLVGMGFIVLFGIILSEAGSRRRAMITPQYAATGTIDRLAPRADIAVLAQDSSGIFPEASQAPGATAERTVLAGQPARDTSAARQLAANLPRRPPAESAVEHVLPPASETVAVQEADPPTEQTDTTPTEPVIPPAQPASAISSVYVVRKNDNLTKIARTVLGTASPEAVQAIYEANRDELKSIHQLRVGQQLQIPNSLDSPAHPRRQADRPAGDAVPKHPEPPQRWYQIKQNDTWSSIARHELGNRARWRELYELNRGKFPNPNRIRPGVRVKLPADASG